MKEFCVFVRSLTHLPEISFCFRLIFVGMVFKKILRSRCINEVWGRDGRVDSFVRASFLYCEYGLCFCAKKEWRPFLSFLWLPSSPFCFLLFWLALWSFASAWKFSCACIPFFSLNHFALLALIFEIARASIFFSLLLFRLLDFSRDALSVNVKKAWQSMKCTFVKYRVNCWKRGWMNERKFCFLTYLLDWQYKCPILSSFPSVFLFLSCGALLSLPFDEPEGPSLCSVCSPSCLCMHVSCTCDDVRVLSRRCDAAYSGGFL